MKKLMKIFVLISLLGITFPTTFLSAAEEITANAEESCSLNIYTAPDGATFACQYGFTAFTGGGTSSGFTDGSTICYEKNCDYYYDMGPGQYGTITITRTDIPATPEPTPPNDDGNDTPPTNDGGEVTNDPIANGDKGTNAPATDESGDETPIDGTEIITPTLKDISTDATSYGLNDEIVMTLVFNNPDKVLIESVFVNDKEYPATKISDTEYTIVIPVNDFATEEGEFLLTVNSITIKNLENNVLITENNEVTITIDDFNLALFLFVTFIIIAIAGTIYFINSTKKGKDFIKKTLKNND